MSYTYLLAGENLELAESELKGFLKTQGVSTEINRVGRIAETREEPSELKRLALTHEVGKKLFEIEASDLEDFEPDFEPKGSFSVRSEFIGDIDKDKEIVEEILGEKFSGYGNDVDLDSPKTELKAYLTDGKIIVSRIIEDLNRGLFDRRANQERPFSSPISLDPVLARVLVNLSGLSAGGQVLDPFCGTGGILIEAGLCGMGVNGFDVQEDMVEGCITNLEEYGIINHNITQKDISEVIEKDLNKFKGIVTDLPYGNSSKKTGNAVKKFLGLLNDFEGTTVFMYDEKEIGNHVADYSVYVHKSLTRYIYVLE